MRKITRSSSAFPQEKMTPEEDALNEGVRFTVRQGAQPNLIAADQQSIHIGNDNNLLSSKFQLSTKI